MYPNAVAMGKIRSDDAKKRVLYLTAQKDQKGQVNSLTRRLTFGHRLIDSFPLELIQHQIDQSSVVHRPCQDSIREDVDFVKERLKFFHHFG